jgi:hypothetical protein
VDYTTSFLSNDDQTTVTISSDLVEQITEQLGEEYVRPDDFVESAVRQQLAALQHETQSASPLQEI